MAIKIVGLSSLVFKNHNTFTTQNSKTISGQIQENSIPLPCHVRLFDQKSGELLSQVRSDNKGRYTFSNLNSESVYFIIVHHPDSIYNAVILDSITTNK